MIIFTQMILVLLRKEISTSCNRKQYWCYRMEAALQRMIEMNAPISALRQFDLNADGYLSPEEIEEGGGLGYRSEIRQLLKQDLLEPNRPGIDLLVDTNQSFERCKVPWETLGLSMRDARANPWMSNTNLVVEGSRTYQ